MAKNGFKVLDSDMHIMEPTDLWPRYLPPEFREQAPLGRKSENVRDLKLKFPDKGAEARRTGDELHAGQNYEKNQNTYRDHSERGWTGEVQLEAMGRGGHRCRGAVSHPGPPRAWIIRDTHRTSPRPWRGRTTTGFTTSAAPTPTGCSAPA